MAVIAIIAVNANTAINPFLLPSIENMGNSFAKIVASFPRCTVKNVEPTSQATKQLMAFVSSASLHIPMFIVQTVVMDSLPPV